MYDELNGTTVSGYEFSDILGLLCPNPKEEEFVTEDKGDDEEITVGNKVKSLEMVF
ncbi:unnamed protein product [Schistosoma margrebowiei]|uniref:Uncharacterized protein n=1 Tax=Schistosoma margrebowiei TaxID=48269 RepID=A0A183MWQ4_9TREM|nr:unnamed protein product [Schistosoma margrebowiei]